MGFAFRSESPYDCYGAGHAGTALSAALGMAAARDHAGTGEHVICIAGDAALTNALQEHVKANVAPYKYPRAIEYVTSLPRTETGKLQRFELRRIAAGSTLAAPSPRQAGRRSG